MARSSALADVFRAVADPTRRRMVELLRGSELSVSELARPFRISQPAVSQHLRVLREAGVVSARREGRRRVYRFEPRPLERVYEWSARQLADPLGHVWSVAAGGEAE